MTMTWFSEEFAGPTVEDKVVGLLYVACLMALFSAALTIML